MSPPQRAGIGELETRLREDPDSPGLRVALAGALHRAGRAAEAFDLYRSVARSYRDQGRTQQAIAVCHGILELAADDARTRQLLATLTATSSVPTLEATPLPPALPHHVADPTTNIIKKLGELELDPQTERVERMYPLDTPDSDTEDEMQHPLAAPPHRPPRP